MSEAGASQVDVPALRFPEFSGAWKVTRLGQFFEEHREKSTVQDEHEVLTSARTGLIRQREYYDNERITERENIGFNIIPPEFLTYRSRSDDRKFYFNKNILGITGIISIYYPVFRIINGSNRFFAEIFSRYVDYIGKFSVGTSQTVLSMNELKRIRLPIPTLPEQQKIADFLGAVDARMGLLRRRRDALAAYKKAMMQRLFARSLRFTKPDGSPFPDWQEKRLGEVLTEHGERSTGNERVHSVSVHKGVIDQIEHLGRSFSAANTDRYSLVKPGDVIYTKSPTGDFPFGIVKQNRLAENVIVSPLYGVFTPETYALGYILNDHFLSVLNTHNYLHQLVQKGAKNTINITNNGFLQGRLTLPVHPGEQQKIAAFLTALDTKIDAIAVQIAATRRFKQGLLQQMLV